MMELRLQAVLIAKQLVEMDINTRMKPVMIQMSLEVVFPVILTQLIGIALEGAQLVRALVRLNVETVLLSLLKIVMMETHLLGMDVQQLVKRMLVMIAQPQVFFALLIVEMEL